MPRQGNNVVCPNDSSNMDSPDGFHALTEVNRNENDIQFNPASGIPVKVYVCRQCGYIETYHAQTDQNW